MDDQSFLQQLHDKQPLMWTRGEINLLWERLEASDLLRQSLQSNAALRDRAATVLAQADLDLDLLLQSEQVAEHKSSSGSKKGLLIAAVVVAFIAIGGLLIFMNRGEDNSPVVEAPPSDAPPTETISPEPEIPDDPPTDEENPPNNQTEPPDNPPAELSPAEPEPDQPPPERPYVKGPWDSVMALDPPPKFEEICFDDFDLERSTLKEDYFDAWVTDVSGERFKAAEMRRNSRRAIRFGGLARLQAPWTNDSWIRLSIVETRQFAIHMFAGNRGLTLAHYVDGGRQWVAYTTTRESGKPRPASYALTAADDRIYSRTLGHEDATIMIGWRDGEVLVCRGDIVLLRAPMEFSPRDVFMEGPALIEGIELVRTIDAPQPIRRTSLQPLAAPADMEWNLERLPEKDGFEKLEDGSVRLAREKPGEPAWVVTDLPLAGMRSIVFEISDYKPGAGVLLKHDEQGLSRSFRVVNNRSENRLNLVMAHDFHSWEMDLGKVEERRTGEIADRVYVKLLQGWKILRCWVSVDGDHWAELMFPAAQHNTPITGIGLMLAGNAPDQSLTLRSVSVEPLSNVHALVGEELLQKAPAITEASNYGDWLVEACAAQPPGADSAAWRTACAIQTVGRGCPREVADILLEGLLETIIATDWPLDQKCDALDEALLFARGWEDGNRLLETVTGRYFEAGMKAYLAGETHYPFTSVRRRAMSGPYVHYGSPRLAQTEAANWELLHLTSTGRWNEALATCEQLEFFYADHHVSLSEWAEAAAQREVATAGGTAAITPLKATWRHPLEEELSKEAYNLLAELKALLDSRAYNDAARLITQVNPTAAAGVAPGPGDDHLLLSMTAAIHWAFEEHPQLADAMRSQFSDLAELRIRKAISEGFAPDVILAATQFSPTAAAGTAHAWLGDRALSVGRFPQAIAEYRQAFDKADSLTRAEIEPRLRLAAAMMGNDLGVPPDGEVRLGSASVAADEFERIVAGAKTRAEQQGTSVASVSATESPVTVPPPSQWKAEKRGQIEGPTGHDHNGGGHRHARDLRIPWVDRQLATQVVGETMYVANRFQVSAYRLSDGHRLWQSQTPEGNQRRAQDWPLVRMRPLIVGDRIFTRMLYGEGAQLVCFNRENGQLLWNAPGSRTHVFASDPLLIAGDLFVVVWEYQRDQYGRLMLYRYDLHSGELLQSHGLVSLRDSWFERRVCEVASLGDGLLIAAGGVVLKATVGGQVDWIRHQPLSPPEEHRRWALQYWQRPRVVDGTAYVVQPGVMAIEAMDTDSGKLLWSRSVIDLQRMLGVIGERIIVQYDDRLVAIDRHKGSEVWVSPVDSHLLDGFTLDKSQLLIAARRSRRQDNWEVTPELLSFDVTSGEMIASSPLPELKHADPQISALTPADERLWLFHGRGYHEVHRDLVELKPEGQLTPLPPPLPARERAWLGHVDSILQDGFSRVAPGWTLRHSHYDARDNLGMRDEERGREHVLALFITQEAPLVVAREVSFPERSRPKLRMVVGAEPGRNWHFRATCAGKEYPVEVSQAFSNEYWKTIEIDLAEQAGKSGWLTVELQSAAGGDHPVFVERLELIQ